MHVLSRSNGEYTLQSNTCTCNMKKEKHPKSVGSVGSVRSVERIGCPSQGVHLKEVHLLKLLRPPCVALRRHSVVCSWYYVVTVYISTATSSFGTRSAHCAFLFPFAMFGRCGLTRWARWARWGGWRGERRSLVTLSSDRDHDHYHHRALSRSLLSWTSGRGSVSVINWVSVVQDYHLLRLSDFGW